MYDFFDQKIARKYVYKYILQKKQQHSLRFFPIAQSIEKKDPSYPRFFAKGEVTKKTTKGEKNAGVCKNKALSYFLKKKFREKKKERADKTFFACHDRWVVFFSFVSLRCS